MSKAKPKIESENFMDLSDEKKVEILSKDFHDFQKRSSEKLGLQIGVRLVSNETKIEAVLIPVKVRIQKDEENRNEKTEESK